MAYLGNQPTSSDYTTDFFDGTGAQTLFVVSETPVKANAILVFVSGVKQASDTYSVVGTNLTFTEAPPVGSNNVEVMHLGIRREIVQPAIDSVTSAEIAANAVTSSEIAPDAVTSSEIDMSDSVAIRTGLSLDNVDNTSDINKPVSTAQQDAIDLKSDYSVTDYITTKTFFTGEEFDVTLDSNVNAPYINSTKEVVQVGVSDNRWNVSSAGYSQESNKLSIDSNGIVVDSVFGSTLKDISGPTTFNVLSDIAAASSANASTLCAGVLKNGNVLIVWRGAAETFAIFNSDLSVLIRDPEPTGAANSNFAKPKLIPRNSNGDLSMTAENGNGFIVTHFDELGEVIRSFAPFINGGSNQCVGFFPNGNVLVIYAALWNMYDINGAAVDNGGLGETTTEVGSMTLVGDGTRMYCTFHTAARRSYMVFGDDGTVIVARTTVTMTNINSGFTLGWQHANGDGVIFSPQGTSGATIYKIDQTTYASTSLFTMPGYSDGAFASFNANKDRVIIGMAATSGVDDFNCRFKAINLADSSIEFDTVSVSSLEKFRAIIESSEGNYVALDQHRSIAGDMNTYKKSTLDFLHTSEYIPAITSQSGINSTFWTDINSMTPTENIDGQTLYYSVSVDDKTTWQVYLTGNPSRDIVRDNASTWEYNSNATYGSTTWTPATTNNEYQAIAEAMTISVNRMDSAQIIALSDAEQPVLGNKLDFATILYTNNDSFSPIFSGVDINYDANTEKQYCVPGVDVEYVKINDTTIRVRSLADNNLIVRITQ